MVALTDLIAAKTPGEYDCLQRQFRAEHEAVPSDAEVLTAALRDCIYMDGAPVLGTDEYADRSERAICIRKLS